MRRVPVGHQHVGERRLHQEGVGVALAVPDDEQDPEEGHVEDDLADHVVHLQLEQSALASRLQFALVWRLERHRTRGHRTEVCGGDSGSQTRSWGGSLRRGQRQSDNGIGRKSAAGTVAVRQCHRTEACGGDSGSQTTS